MPNEVSARDNSRAYVHKPSVLSAVIKMRSGHGSVEVVTLLERSKRSATLRPWQHACTNVTPMRWIHARRTETVVTNDQRSEQDKDIVESSSLRDLHYAAIFAPSHPLFVADPQHRAHTEAIPAARIGE